MSPSESHESFNVDRLRDPFRHETPRKIFRTNSLRDRIRQMLCGLSEQDFPQMRASMLKIAGQEFVGRQRVVRERMQTYDTPPYSKADAAFVSVLGTFDDSIRHVAEHHEDFRSTMAEYDHAHIGKKYASPTIKNGRDELLEFVRHGTGTMVAFQEVLPIVFESEQGRPPSGDELYQLLLHGSDRIFSILTRMPGPYAIEVEKMIGQPNRHLGFENTTYKRPVFNPAFFHLRNVAGNPMADLDSDFVDFVVDTVRPSRTQYHGCLAGLVNVESPSRHHSSAHARLFEYLKHTLAALMSGRHVATDVSFAD